MKPKLSRQEIARLFAEHGPAVHRRALRMLRDPADAEEATQEVFVRVLRGAEAYSGRAAPTTWLFQITTNYCLNRIRDAARRRALFEEFTQAHPQGHSHQVDLTTLRWLLSNADPRQAQAATYVHLDGMSHAEAAKLMGVSKRTVGNLIARFNEWSKRHIESVNLGSSSGAQP